MSDAYSDLPRVYIELPDGQYPQCLLEGMRDVVRSGNPHAAHDKFIPEPDFEDREWDKMVDRTTLHCASKVLGLCKGQISCVTEVTGTGLAPETGAIFPEDIEAIDCFQQEALNRSRPRQLDDRGNL